MALVGEAHIIVRAITNQVQKDIQRSFNDINATANRAGSDAASSFSNGFQRRFGGNNIFSRVARSIQEMVPGAMAARQQFTSLVRTGYTLTTGLSVLVGGIFSVIGGLGALVGSAGGAAASLAVLGNSVFAIAAGMIATRLALGGVGQAVQRLNRQATGAAPTPRKPSTRAADNAVESARQAEIDSAERVRDAEEDLARVIERNRERMVDANNAVLDAQKELNEAFKDGREEIQQIGFEAEDAALAEQEAALELAKARETLQRVQDLPPNNRARQAAELAYKQAELNLRKAQDRTADLSAEQDRLARTGVKGTDAYVKAADNLSKAEEDRARTTRDAIQDEADARKSLARAQVSQIEAAERVGDAQERLADIMDAPLVGGPAWDEGLNDAQRKFALFIAGLKPQFDELERIASEAFLPKLQEAIQTLMDKAYPTVAVGIGLVASAMGDAAISIANAITESRALENLATVFTSSAELLRLFGSTIGSVWKASMAILAGSSEQAERYFTYLDGEMSKFSNYVEELQANGQLAAFFKTAGDMAAQFGDIFGNIFGGLGAIIQANFGPGTGGWMLLEWLQEATQKFADLASTPEKLAALSGYFQGVATNVVFISQSIGELLKGLIGLGDNPAIGQTFLALERGAPFLTSIVEKSIEAGPFLGELVASLVEMIDVLTDSVAVELFFSTLNTAIQTVTDFLKNDTVKTFMDFTGRIFAVISAIGLIGSVGLFAFKAVAGMISNTAGALGVLTGGFGTFKSALDGFKSGGLTGGLKAIRDGFNTTGSDKDKLIDNLGLFDKKTADTAAKTAPLVSSLGVLGGGFAKVGGAVKTGAMAAFSSIGSVLATAGAGLATFGRALLGIALGPVGIIIGAIALLVTGLIALYNHNEEFRKAVDDGWAQISQALTSAGQQIMTALQPIIETFSNLITELAPVFGQIVGLFSTIISVIIDALVPVFAAIITALAPVVQMIAGLLVPVIGFLVGAIVPLITLFVGGLVPVINLVATVLTFLIGIIVEILKVVITVFTNVVTFIIGALTTVITGVIDFITGFSTNWTNFWDGVFKTIDDIWKNISSALDAAWRWINDYVFAPIVAAVEWVSDAFEFGGKVIEAAWKLMQDGLNAVFKWIDTYIFKPIRDAVDLVADGFELAGKLVALAWQQMQDQLFAVFKWIDDNVFTPIKNAVSLVQQAFELVGQGIARAWEGIKKAAADPVNFVIDTVYNQGILPFWNGLAGSLGMESLKLQPAPTVKFATGGVMPGYSPGKDIHKFFSPTGGYLHLSGGEAIMRPEWTRAVGGPAAVARMNARARRGQAFANGGVFNGGTQRFADGGVFNFGDLLEDAARLAGVVGDFIANPKKAIEKHFIDGLIKPAMGSQGNGGFAQIVGGIPVKIASWIGEHVTKIFSESGGPKGEGMGWEAMWAIVKNAIPGAVKTSDYRPGSMTVNGTPSYHGSGRAIDVIPATMATFERMLQLFPNARELIFSPAGSRQLLNGKPFNGWSSAVRAQHYNHIHAAMANGGTVFPSTGGSIVQVAEAGRAERIEPLHPNGLSDRDLALIDRLAGDQGPVQITIDAKDYKSAREIAEEVSEILANKRRRGGF